MYEVELKLRADHERVRSRLSEMDATPQETVIQEDTYFDAPDRTFAETDEALRVRREHPPGETGDVFLTYKGPLVEEKSKTREEAETRVGSEETIRAILDGLGYETAATVRKKRSRYTYRDCTVTLDAVDDLGEFVEVELETDQEIATGETEAGERLDTLREKAIDVLETLGLDPNEQIRTSYLDLLLTEQP